MFKVSWVVHDIYICEPGRIKFKIKSSKQYSKGYSCLHKCELIANAFSRATTEWKISKISCNFVWIKFVLPFRRVVTFPVGNIWIFVGSSETIRIKRIRVRPKSFITMNVVQNEENVHSTDYGCLATTPLRQMILSSAPPNQQRWLWVHSKCLSNDKSQIFH
mmetsp:Transcript_111338/g.319904  ORF Transcript_111338/g.319904 Transcript_111338/m.319904 type:complete len:162 (-) Transcript_111338:1405-1890(-)